MSADENKASPFEIGQKCLVKWKDGEFRKAEILEREAKDSEISDSFLRRPSNECVYYVHYIGFDKRLDEWVRHEDVKVIEEVAVEASLSQIPSKSKHHSSLHKYNRPPKRTTFKEAIEKIDLCCFNEYTDKGKAMTNTSLENDVKAFEKVTKVKNIQLIEFGRFEIETWYYSPFPGEDYRCLCKLYVCEFCLKYMRKESTMSHHKHECIHRCPPGRVIYQEERVKIYEVDGRQKMYCQNLCFLSKLFLDRKTMFFNVEPFVFYVLCEVNSCGAHMVGFFSKEKHSPEKHNLACLLIFPPYQKKGYGKLLISLSYEISKFNGEVGSPEKPLSDLGLVGYKSYWSNAVLSLIMSFQGNISIKEISKKTGISVNDVIVTLKSLGLIGLFQGKHFVKYEAERIDELYNGLKSSKMRLIDVDKLFLSPLQLRKRRLK